MPFRLGERANGEFRAKIQFTTAAWMPYRIYQACLATDTHSNTRYCQEAVCEKLARDLDLDLDELLAGLPATRGTATHLFSPDDPQPGTGKPSMYARKTPPVGYGMGHGDQEVR